MTLKRTGTVSQGPLLHDIRRLIEETRSAVAVTVNVGLTMLYWEIGTRIRQNILKNRRVAYGEEIVSTLSRQLEPEFVRGFSAKALHHMVRFAEAFGATETRVLLRVL